VTNQSMSGSHESTTCTLGSNGGPCELCQLANESERVRVRGLNEFTPAEVQAMVAGLLATGGSGDDVGDDDADEFSPAVNRRLLTAIQRDGQAASVTVVRAAIADVLDTGCTCYDEKHPWELDDGPEDNEDDVNQQRERFIDAVTARIAELQAPPHNMDARLLAEVERTRKERKEKA
jgi:hypothetical protein